MVIYLDSDLYVPISLIGWGEVRNHSLNMEQIRANEIIMDLFPPRYSWLSLRCSKKNVVKIWSFNIGIRTIQILIENIRETLLCSNGTAKRHEYHYRNAQF